MEITRTLGRSRPAAFLAVTVPMARPALAAGVALAMMEALADFGTVATFGYRTLTEAIYRVWYGMFDRIAATQLASVLLLFALALLLLEHRSRGRARFIQRGRPSRALEPEPLRGLRAAAATAVCVGVLGPAFVLPVGQLAWWALAAVRGGRVAPDFLALLEHTALLAAAAAGLACALAVLLAYAGRLRAPSRSGSRPGSRPWATRCPARSSRWGCSCRSRGPITSWCPPLSGTRSPARPAPHRVRGGADPRLRRPLPRGGAAVGGGEPWPHPSEPRRRGADAGARAGVALRRVHLPLIRGGLLTALVLVFVEAMKEMPATLLLRPFGLNTLAIEIWERTSEAM